MKAFYLEDSFVCGDGKIDVELNYFTITNHR